jgi:hypothetical protein
VKKAIFFYILVPLFGLLSVIYIRLWGWEKAGYHALFGLLVSTCLLQVLFLRYPKIPFACTFVPGKARVHTRWIFYVAGFVFYTSALSRYEKEIFWSPAEFRNFLLFLAVLIAVFEATAHLRLYRNMTMIYEEEPESVMVTLTDH